MPWGLMLESGKKLTVRASATTTTRNWARYWLAIPRKKGPTDLGAIITSTIVLHYEHCVDRGGTAVASRLAMAQLQSVSY